METLSFELLSFGIICYPTALGNQHGWTALSETKGGVEFTITPRDPLGELGFLIPATLGPVGLEILALRRGIHPPVTQEHTH